MVSTPGARGPYTGGTEGAPPPPPAGGYRGARRVVPFEVPSVPTEPAPRVRPSGFSALALAVAVVFAFVLMIMGAVGATDTIYSLGTILFQVAVVVIVIAALMTARGRLLGTIALGVVLLANIGTLGAASAITHPPSKDSIYVSPQDEYWAAYPGIKGQSEPEILNRTSLEEASAQGEALMAAIRARLTRDFGFQWIQGTPGGTRNERNGYGGESMLVEYWSPTWATTQPITDYSTKLQVMYAIDDVLWEHGFWGAVAFNELSSGFEPDYIERLFGSTDPRTQPLWEWYSNNDPEPIAFYADIYDLTYDDDGSFRAAREAQVAGSNEPLEGLFITVYIREVLSEADVDEFRERMKAY